MLKIQNDEHFNKVVSQISESEHWEMLLEDFEENIKYLHHYGGDRFNVYIGYDSSPLSFSLQWEDARTGVSRWPGGLLFHPGNYCEDRSFAIELVSSKKPHWMVHT